MHERLLFPMGKQKFAHSFSIMKLPLFTVLFFHSVPNFVKLNGLYLLHENALEKCLLQIILNLQLSDISCSKGKLVATVNQSVSHHLVSHLQYSTQGKCQFLVHDTI